jgi:hypothetical protein
MRPWRRALAAAAALFALAAPLAAEPSAPLPAATAAVSEPPAGAEAAALDEAVRGLLGQARYAWRSPRAAQAAATGSLPLQFLRSALDWAQAGVESLGRRLSGLGRRLGKLLERLLRSLPDDWLNRRTPESAPELGAGPLWAVWALLAVVACLLGLLLYRALRRSAAVAPMAAAAAVAVDLAAPQLSGAELPESSWLSLAEGLARQGEHRLALRAYFLAGLNALGQARLLSLAPSRSVGDYRRQLKRRSDEGGQARAVFEDFSRLYEQCWYGLRPVGAADCAQARRWQEGLHAPGA